MEISLETLKILREKTGAGMVDCKQALEESAGDIEKAVEILRKQGIAKASKRVGRETSEGIIKVAVNEAGNEGYMVEVNAETDFVVRNAQFQEFVEQVFGIVKEQKPKDREELLSKSMDNGTVRESLESLSGVIGEKLDIKRAAVLTSGGTVAAYSHMGGKIGVLVALDKPGMGELAGELAMQIAAASPKYLAPENVPVVELDKEKEIYREQLLKEGKPENMIDKIMGGKINKYYEEVCLLNQEYIKDDKKKVAQILGDANIEAFVRYSLN